MAGRAVAGEACCYSANELLVDIEAKRVQCDEIWPFCCVIRSLFNCSTTLACGVLGATGVVAHHGSVPSRLMTILGRGTGGAALQRPRSLCSGVDWCSYDIVRLVNSSKLNDVADLEFRRALEGQFLGRRVLGEYQRGEFR